ncbi:alpha-ketoglutarate-dependent dioxygenase AlkB family protein [Chitinophagaceae bacterium LWZ2-11]
MNNILPFDGEVFLYENFYNRIEADGLFIALQEEIDWKQESIKIFGKEKQLPRLTAWYGDEGKSYTYSGLENIPIPFSGQLITIKEKLESFTKYSFNAALLNFYRTGTDSMGWHSDNEKELGINPVIASLSFGGSRVFQLKHKVDKASKQNITLNTGSLLLMKGSTQHNWLHQVPKTVRPIEARINITFRNIQ